MKYSNKEIVRICKSFTKGLGINLNGSYNLIVDPLSAYLNACGIHNDVAVYEKYRVLQLEFKDGRMLIPDASSLPINGVKDWMWVYEVCELIKDK